MASGLLRANNDAISIILRLFSKNVTYTSLSFNELINFNEDTSLYSSAFCVCRNKLMATAGFQISYQISGLHFQS